MRRVFVAVVIPLGLVLGSGCVTVAPQPAGDQIRAVLDQYVLSVEREDLDLYGRVMAHDADVVHFGTSGAPIQGWDSLKKVIADQFAGLDSVSVAASEVQVHVLPGGTAAWATSLWRFRGKAGQTALDLPVRCTWILEKRAGAWVIVHFHKSVAAAS